MAFPGRGLLIALIVGLLVVPLQLALVPMLQLHNKIGIGQSYLGIWLAHSHTSDQHAWYQRSAKDRSNDKSDWYVWADPKPDGTPPNNRLSIFGGPAWTWCPAREQYYLHNFLKSQPDLNFHNPQVQDAVLDVTRFWLDRGGGRVSP